MAIDKTLKVGDEVTHKKIIDERGKLIPCIVGEIREGKPGVAHRVLLEYGERVNGMPTRAWVNQGTVTKTGRIGKPVSRPKVAADEDGDEDGVHVSAGSVAPTDPPK